MMHGIVHSAWFKFSLMLVGVLVLEVSVSGCAGSLDLERLGDNAKPEAVPYRWFIDTTHQDRLGNLQNWPLLEPCWLTIDSFDFDLKNNDAERASRSARARLEAIDDEHDKIGLFWQGEVKNGIS